MGQLLRLGRAYPLVPLTLAVGAAAGLLVALGLGDAARWGVSAYALVTAAVKTREIVRDLRRGRYGIDVLAVTALAATVAVGEHWAALVVCLMLATGEALDDYAVGRAERELAALLARSPQTAHRVAADGTLQQVPVEEVEVGDELLVRPGEVVPTDGDLVSAEGSFDESSLTGEPLPVERVRGQSVLSGSVAGPEVVHLRATATAADSQYQRIVDLVRSAGESRAPFVRLADRVALPFTLLSLAVAALAWGLSGDPTRFAEVLVVATPCPLIIAAPVAFMAGMSRAARHGVIVKDGGTLEQLARARTAAFDKTGTLTHGRPQVAAVHATGGLTDEQLLTYAAAVEQSSVHPLAAAVVAAARERGLPLLPATDARESTAHGVVATVQGRGVAVGKHRFVAGLCSTTPGVTPPLEPGQSAVHVAVDSEYAGLVALADQVREETAATLTALRRAGVRTTMMLTGDAEPTAWAIARQVGIDDVRAGLLPEDKVAAVASAPERPVLMVGDGVNDAPVLAVADVGVAMGARGSTAAGESADVVVMLDDLQRVALAVQIGRRTLTVAWQAIGLGVGLSLALMVVAALGHLPAVAGAWMQEVVDLACIGWALLATQPGAIERQEPAPTPSARTQRLPA
ncbi:heavy metal translocating P-type ATPase [Ornithinimicrobium sediminis]|uniref:heavy metal translocating P-type ATPase n=1 Tax=Ornithinimicrobium sediminis TaxID=2904603 RepID=UPI001E48BE44|nr:cadmium-translocating P-type ATPase [Ornithinimicrobium sediminis]